VTAMNALGRHILAEYYGCDIKILNDVKLIEHYMREAVVKSGATIIDSTFHRFNPHGVSGVVVIAESHMALHTWPEHGYAAVDFFTCGDSVDPWKALTYMSSKLKSSKTSSREIMRGLIEHETQELCEVQL
jgi:S-adenosylmethionine decarboxylase